MDFLSLDIFVYFVCIMYFTFKNSYFDFNDFFSLSSLDLYIFYFYTLTAFYHGFSKLVLVINNSAFYICNTLGEYIEHFFCANSADTCGFAVIFFRSRKKYSNSLKNTPNCLNFHPKILRHLFRGWQL